MEIDVQISAVSGSFFALVMVLLAVAMAHPDPQIRARAERLIGKIFGNG
ncbi:hypothetical protein [Streptomyces catenulae]|uniref:Uncharacterized protein n=1 Tax=Streptomyces catenulae TaxID=66875 RepID=A0ABV2YXP6_9ACTN|nr:hypothetical protein [Streptomyces catenulae]